MANFMLQRWYIKVKVVLCLSLTLLKTKVSTIDDYAFFYDQEPMFMNTVRLPHKTFF